MIRHVTITEALAHPQLLAAALGDLSTWTVWVSVLKAAYANPLDAVELEAFKQVAGNRQPPTKRVRELAVVASRRCGKGRAMGALCAYEAALVQHHLAPGEVGTVACVSPTREQAKIVQRYALGYLEASPLLRDEIMEVTATEIRLHNGNVIVTLASDYRTLRGRTLLLACVDEASFLRDETSATPDVEVVRALLPGLTTTGGLLCVMSSPYAQRGLLFQRHRDYFGKDDPNTLVAAGASTSFNPTLDQAVIDAAIASDPEAAQAEWLGAWRKDLQTFLPDDLIDAAIDRARPLELAPQDDIAFKCFVDASGGAHDSFTLAISHKRDDGRVIVDVIRGKRAPFDPASVAREFSLLAREYHCGTVTGDCYSAGWVKGAFEANGVEYKQSPLTRSELYLEGLPLFSRGMVSIPDHSQTLREMRLLQRRTAKSGRDSVDHGAGGTDDFVNSLFGSLYLVTKKPRLEALVGLGGKVFNSTGATISDGVSGFLDKFKPKPAPSTNDEVFAAGLKAQHEEMKLRIEGPPQPPPELTPRLAAFKKEHEAKRTGVGNFVGKCFGNGVQY
jgi:hypothetical protein